MSYEIVWKWCPWGSRAARFCHAAAHGGQITAPLRLIQRTIRVWTSNGLVTDHDGAISAEPLHVQVPEGVDASLLPWRAAASDTLLSGCSNMHSLLHMRHQTRGSTTCIQGWTALVDLPGLPHGMFQQWCILPGPTPINVIESTSSK